MSKKLNLSGKLDFTDIDLTAPEVVINELLEELPAETNGLICGKITDDDFIYYLENCKKYEIDINNAIRKKEVNINKYGIKAVRLMYDGDYLKEMIKEYIAGNSMFK